MNLDKFTIKSQEIIQAAQQKSLLADHQSIDTLHLLSSQLELDKSVTSFLLEKLNVDIISLVEEVEKRIEKIPKVKGASQYLSQSAQKVIAKAQQYAKEMEDSYVTSEHLLLAMLSDGEVVSDLLKSKGLKIKGLKTAILDLRKGKNLH